MVHSTVNMLNAVAEVKHKSVLGQVTHPAHSLLLSHALQRLMTISLKIGLNGSHRIHARGAVLVFKIFKFGLDGNYPANWSTLGMF